MPECDDFDRNLRTGLEEGTNRGNLAEENGNQRIVVMIARGCRHHPKLLISRRGWVMAIDSRCRASFSLFGTTAISLALELKFHAMAVRLVLPKVLSGREQL